ncbi:MAG: helix-turn-helix domain-containing protein [Deltaproteobacteria bacterium]|nr:helix-turn-helix domain-containing protein [Deltaproteobacteria bacterium]
MKGWLQPWRVAKYLDCSREHVYQLVAQGKLEAIRLGPRAIRISEASLQGFINKMKVEAEREKN